MDFSFVKEVDSFSAQPKAMPVGTPGKTGYLCLGFELDSDGKSVMRNLDRRAPLIVQQELYFDELMPEMPCVYILSSGGPNVDGDRYEQNFTVKQGAFAHISTGAATKLAEMRYNYSGMIQNFILEEDTYLEYLPEPTIPCRNTRYVSDTTIRIAPSATLFYSEIFMSGRKHCNHGERFKYDILSICTHAERHDGKQLFREKFIIRPNKQSPCNIGAMDDYDVFANVVVVTPEHHADMIYERTDAFIDSYRHLAAGITRLPNNCGLSYKVLGDEVSPVKQLVREFCSSVRYEIKGKYLQQEFPWR